MLNYNIVPYNITRTRMNLDDAFADEMSDRMKLLENAKERFEEHVASEYNTIEASVIKMSQSTKYYERVETFATNEQKVHDEKIAAGYIRANFKTITDGVRITYISYWAKPGHNLEEIKSQIRSDAKAEYDVKTKALDSVVRAYRKSVKELQTWYLNEVKHNDLTYVTGDAIRA